MNSRAYPWMLGAAILAAPQTASADPTVRECLAASERSLELHAGHHLRAERDALLACAASSCPETVRDECARRLTIVSQAIPTLVLEAKDASGADVPGASASVDGVPLTARLDGSALPLDPGEHVVRVEVAGLPPATRTLVVHEGEKVRREVFVLGGAPAAQTPVVTSKTPGESASPAPATWGTQKTVAVVVGGVGLVGVVLGTIFGVRTESLWSNAKTECASPTSCPAHDQAQRDHDDALAAATVSNVAFALGGAALAGAAVLYFTAPSAEVQAGPAATMGGGEIVVRGRF